MATAAAEGLGALTPTFMRAVRDHPPAKTLFDHHISAARTTLEALITDAIEQDRLRAISATTAAEAVVVLVLHFTDPEHAHSPGQTSAAALTLVFELLIAGAEPRL